MQTIRPFSEPINTALNKLNDPIQLGPFQLNTPFILAPMASICTPAFRLLMQDLGAPMGVSELISADGVFFRNKKTIEMMAIDKREKCVGIQIFGHELERMLDAALFAQDQGAHFIDINMGCPVRKVVTKGGGSALLRSPQELFKLLYPIRKALSIPLTIKIRTGWDTPNAPEVVAAAADSGVTWVAIHGRTRTQQYKGQADWEYIENLAANSPLPIIGNGDLHAPADILRRWPGTKCQALMIARGCLQDPFIFLTNTKEESFESFNGHQHLEVINRYLSYMQEWTSRERTLLIQMKKMIHWFSSGFPGSVAFRKVLFPTHDLDQLMENTAEFFTTVGERKKHIQNTNDFLTSGHG